MAVVPTGEKTAEGKDIFKAAPTETDIKRAVSEKRVQTFRSGKKVSDTQRVQLPTGEFVTIASAKALSKAGSATFIQAQQKQAEIDRLTQEAVKQAGFDIEKITRRQDSQREKVAKLIIAESKARGTAAESLFKQRRIEEQEKLGKLERGAAVLVQFTTAGGRAVAQVQVLPKKIFRKEVTVKKEKELRDIPLEDFPSIFKTKVKEFFLGPEDTGEPPTPEELILQVQKERRGFAQRVLDVPIGFVKDVFVGGGKSIFGPNIPGFADKPLIDIGQTKIFKTKGPLTQDPQFQTFATVVGLSFISGTSPFAAKFLKTARITLGTAFAAAAIKRKEDRPELLGTSLLLFSPEIIKAIKPITFKVPVKKEAPVINEFIELSKQGGGVFGVGGKVTTVFQAPVTGADTGLTTKTLFRGFGIEAFTRAFIVGGFKGLKPVFGTPKLDVTVAEAPFIVQRPGETKILLKSLPTPELREQLGLGIDIIRKTRLTKSKFIRKKFIEESKTLSQKGVKEVLKFAKEQKAEVFGSFAAKQQLPVDLRRVTADIDLKFDKSQERTEELARRLMERLLMQGENVRISQKDPTVIVTDTPEGIVTAVDLKSRTPPESQLLASDIAGTKALGFSLIRRPIKIQKVKVSPLGREAVAKAASIFTLRPGEDLFFGPKEKRIRDIPDFFNIEEALIRSKAFGKERLFAKLEKLKLTFDEEVFEEIPEPTKVKIPLEDEEPLVRRSPFGAISFGGLQTFISPFTSTTLAKAITSPAIAKSLSVSVVPPSIFPKSIVPPSVTPPSVVPPSITLPSVGPPSITPPSITPPSITPPSISPPSISPPSITPPSISPPSPSISISPSLFLGLGPRPKKAQGYDVFVKRKQLKIRKGKFKSRGFLKANKKPITKNVALNRGGKLVDKFTNRTFEIKKVKGKPVPSTERLDRKLAAKFRPSKTKGKKGLRVEKSKFAIDSIEEKKGIPLRAAELRRLGLLETKKRRKKKRRTQQPRQSFGFDLLISPRRKKGRRRTVRFF